MTASKSKTGINPIAFALKMKKKNVRISGAGQLWKLDESGTMRRFIHVTVAPLEDLNFV